MPVDASDAGVGGVGAGYVDRLVVNEIGHSATLAVRQV